MSYFIETLVTYLLTLAGALIFLYFLAYLLKDRPYTWVEKIKKRVEEIKKTLKGPSEPFYVRTLSTDGRKYIDSDELINQPHVEKQMEQMSKLIKERKGQLEA